MPFNLSTAVERICRVIARQSIYLLLRSVDTPIAVIRRKISELCASNADITQLHELLASQQDGLDTLRRLSTLRAAPDADTIEGVARHLFDGMAQYVSPTELRQSIERSLQAAADHYGDRMTFIEPNTPGPGMFRSSSYPRICVRVDDVVLEDDGEVYHLGNFFVVYLIKDSFIVDYIVPETNDYMAEEGNDICHPHVSSFSPCWGNLRESVEQAKRYGLISEFFELGERLLRSYNPDGPYVSLHNWDNPRVCGTGDNRTHCPVCHEPIVDDQDTVTTQEGYVIHQHSCAEYCAARDVWVEAGTATVCPNCQTRVPAVELSQSRHQVCRDCHPELETERVAAARGEFICPFCRTRYAGGEIDRHRLLLGEKVVVCDHCHTVDSDGRVGCILESDRVSPIHGLQVSNVDLSPYARRPKMTIARTVACDCGAHVGEGSLRRCHLTGVNICPACDPDSTGMSPAVWQDRALLDAYLTMWLQSHLQPIDEAYMRIASVYDMELEDAQQLIRTIARSTNFSIPSDALLIADKVHMWNQMAGIVFVTAENGDQHDKEIIAHWRTSGSWGQTLLEQNTERVNELENPASQTQPQRQEAVEGTPNIRITPV